MKILSWNVNGARARIKAGAEEGLLELNPDIIAIQEVRAKDSQLPQTFLSHYNRYHSYSYKAGYAGSSLFIREDMPQPSFFIDMFPDDEEPHNTGRVAIAEFNTHIFIGAYVPNAGSKLERLPQRVLWQDKLKAYISAQTKPIIYCGDLNCNHTALDTACPSIKNGVSRDERRTFQEILNLGMVDVWRVLNPERKQYTWFSTQWKGKAVDRGTRCDYFIVSKELMPHVKSCEIIQDEKYVCGSDHQIVLLDMEV